MNKQSIAYEMARRKVQFHPGKDWNKISLWGLFPYSGIKYALEKGWLINHLSFKPRNVIYWVIPSKSFWLKSIKPLIEKHTLEELSKLAGMFKEV